MKQVINIILNKKSSGKYKPHVTLVYPFEGVNQKNLEEHIKNSIEKIKPFEITLKGLQKSAKDYYLYLLVDQGKQEILKLYKNLNSGLLKSFKNQDMPKYIPHMTLGMFKSKKDIDSAIKDPLYKNLEFSTKITSVQLLTLKKDDSIKTIKDFKLK